MTWVAPETLYAIWADKESVPPWDELEDHERGRWIRVAHAFEPPILRVAEWSTTPGGRYAAESKWSAEEYRDQHILPLLKTSDMVYVNLDDVAGVMPSWLEEVFGGLVRKLGAVALIKVHPTGTVGDRAERARAFMYQALAELP